MRIVGGKYKGKRLHTPMGNKIRPTSDRVKEAIFNIILPQIPSAVVIDAYSGSGALGIEALSRGASKVYFIDNDYKAVELIKKNLQGIAGDYKIIKSSAQKAFATLFAEGVQADLIFLDPPYNSNDFAKAIKGIAVNNILAKDGLTVMEKPAQDENDYSFGALRLTRCKRYGDTAICFFSYVRRIAVTGTFDPITIGHINLVKEALKLSDSVHVVLLKNENKTEFFDVEFRLDLIKKAVAVFGDRVQAGRYDGLAIDYCRDNNVQLIIRGIRDAKDAQYERAMADWNREQGGIETLFIQAKDSHISSSLVRQRLKESLPIQDLVPEELIPLLTQKMQSL